MSATYLASLNDCSLTKVQFMGFCIKKKIQKQKLKTNFPHKNILYIKTNQTRQV